MKLSVLRAALLGIELLWGLGLCGFPRALIWTPSMRSLFWLKTRENHQPLGVILTPMPHWHFTYFSVSLPTLSHSCFLNPCVFVCHYSCFVEYGCLELGFRVITTSWVSLLQSHASINISHYLVSAYLRSSKVIFSVFVLQRTLTRLLSHLFFHQTPKELKAFLTSVTDYLACQCILNKSACQL